MREEVLEFLGQRGTLVDPPALEYLLGQPNPLELLRGLFDAEGEPPFLLTLDNLKPAARPPSAEPSSEVPWEPSAPLPEVLLKPRLEYGKEVKVLRDITGGSTCQGKIEDFSRYFAHRFRVLSALLRGRRELQGAVPISRAKRMAKEVRLVGMVRDVRTTKAGHRLLEVEDEDDSCAVLLTKEGPLAREPVVPDEVVGILGNTWKDELIIAEALVRPDVPARNPWPEGVPPLWVAFASDIHIGSRLFLRERWENFLAWLKGDDPHARALKYLVLVGDLVDGIGVYPRQEEDLLVDDVYRQYEMLAGYLEGVSQGIHVVALPGNHDAVRPAEPQPSLPREIQALFPGDISFHGNPCLMEVQGVRLLAYHGRSMDDLVSSLPGIGYDKPLEGMREMLKRRHLAPIYGGKTPIAPEARDYMVVEEVPHIFATGHVHSAGTEDYRGIRMLNSSTWQAQTSYQRMHNIAPREGQVVLVNLATGEAVTKFF